jgi:hypothetical protein
VPFGEDIVLSGGQRVVRLIDPPKGPKKSKKTRGTVSSPGKPEPPEKKIDSSILTNPKPKPKPKRSLQDTFEQVEDVPIEVEDSSDEILAPRTKSAKPSVFSDSEDEDLESLLKKCKKSQPVPSKRETPAPKKKSKQGKKRSRGSDDETTWFD